MYNHDLSVKVPTAGSRGRRLLYDRKPTQLRTITKSNSGLEVGMSMPLTPKDMRDTPKTEKTYLKTNWWE